MFYKSTSYKSTFYKFPILQIQVWASLWVFPKKSKTRRSPRKKRRSQDWSEDLKLAKIRVITWTLRYKTLKTRRKYLLFLNFAIWPHFKKKKTNEDKTKICLKKRRFTKKLRRKRRPWVPIERLKFYKSTFYKSPFYKSTLAFTNTPFTNLPILITFYQSSPLRNSSYFTICHFGFFCV